MIDIDEPLLSELIETRRALHQQPEVASEVARTSALVAEQLRQAGLEVCTDVGRHGVVASLNRGSGVDPIGLRADMDALPIQEANDFPHRSRHPGHFHGCGHDGHTAMLLGAARLLARHKQLQREIHFIFQPDEENGNGALAMIDAGLFERFDMESVYGLHNLPGLAVGEFAISAGPFCAFEDNFQITVSGSGGHSSMPDKAVDALAIGAGIVVDLQSIVSRSISPTQHAVVSVTGFESDGARNVLASRATISGDCRGFDMGVSEQIESRMRAIVEGSCTAAGAEGRLDYSNSFVPLVNSPGPTESCRSAVSAVPGAVLQADFGRVGFSEDFAQMLRCKPGAYILMGNGVEHPHHGRSLHHPNYDFNDEALAFGVRYWCALALG